MGAADRLIDGHPALVPAVRADRGAAGEPAQVEQRALELQRLSQRDGEPTSATTTSLSSSELASISSASSVSFAERRAGETPDQTPSSWARLAARIARDTWSAVAAA